MKYTPEMIDFLREKVAQGIKIRDIVPLFNDQFDSNVSQNALFCILSQHGIRSNFFYTEEMISFLREEDGNCRSRKELTRRFNEKFGTQKTTASINTFLWEHGIHADWKFRYTKEMDDFICHHYGMTYSELTKLFNEKFKTNKNRISIGMRCRELGLRCSKEMISKINQEYGQAELDFLRKKLPLVKTRSELTRSFNNHFNSKKSEKAICHIVLKYFPDSANKFLYTKEMEDFLKANTSPNISYSILTRIFNESFKDKRTLSAIKAKCQSMGLSCCRGADAKLIIYCDKNKMNHSVDNIETMTKREFQTLINLGMYSEEPEVTKAGIALVRLTRRLKELQKRKRAN